MIMENPTPGPLLERNPYTQQRHRSEVFWQITIPFIVISVIPILFLVIALRTDDAQKISQRADVALIWLLVFMILLSLIVLTLLSVITYTIIKTIGFIPPYFKSGQDFVISIQMFVLHIDDRMVRPVLGMHAFKASASTAVRRVLGK